MPQARKRLVSLDDTPYYHCIARCVRRSFLCGKDPVTGYDFEHRRQWIEDRINLLTTIFSIEICAYAVMSNHYHVVVRINEEQARKWSDQEIARRWLSLFSGSSGVRRWLKGDTLSDYELESISVSVLKWRRRLSDLSWFMRCLNEPIARQANQEDKCTGRFWEGRFKSQALLDEQALISCMAYVDLNPVRATLASTPETSDHTSIQQRIMNSDNHTLLRLQDEPEGSAEFLEHRIPLGLTEYLELLDWAGRALVDGKSGKIKNSEPAILDRLSINPSAMVDFLTIRPELPIRALGSVEKLRTMACSVGLKYLHGVSLAKRLFANTA
jgi:REP element-mobilizing transposase RayT